MNDHRAVAEIDLAAIRHNYNYIQSKVGGAGIIAVVKANAYGHGAVRVSRELEAMGCGMFAVACLDEALQLRKAGIRADILILGITPEEDAPILQEYCITQTVSDLDYAEALNRRANINVHIKVDTGMSRLGIYCHRDADIKAAADEICRISSLENISIKGIFTHFACSDEPDRQFTLKQYSLFKSVCNELQGRGVDIGKRHCCNSAAILAFPEMHMDMVRPGIILYGHPPKEGMTDDKLIPAMKVYCRVYSVKELHMGDKISYGGVYEAQHSMKVAVISIGYADGLSRLLSGKAMLKINGTECPIVGRICMDLCMVDVSKLENVKRGDKAIIFDSADSVIRLAKQMGTINYELICMFRQRVTQTYINACITDAESEET